MAHQLCLITAPGKLAQTLATKLVQHKLCACVNIVPTVKSIYWWENQVQTDEESLLIAKTVSSNREEIIKRVKEWHEPLRWEVVM
jgi:periplasmic divalent cation tolerance protein